MEHHQLHYKNLKSKCRLLLSTNELYRRIFNVFKCGRTCTRKAMPLRTMKPLLVFTILQFLLCCAHGQGNADKEFFQVYEEQPIGTFVGRINTKPGLLYRFQSNSESPPFKLNETNGVITTSAVIDRETLQSDIYKLVVTNYPSVKHIIEVSIQVLDVNDNDPVFGNSRTEVTFSERDSPGTQVILDTATDRDNGQNDVTKDYKIISGNEENKFRLFLHDTSKPLLYLENTVELNREEKEFYTLNISAQDGGNPTKYGYLRVDITVRDYNDNPPLFDQSDYAITINETVPIGTSIMQVTATDQDVGDNADIRYEVTSEKEQFWIDQKTGEIRTLRKLDCYRPCDSVVSDCNTKSCVVTVEARDNGQPLPLTGRAYITVTLIDENDHDPSIRFNKQVAKVDEGAEINDVVAVVTVTDQDDGDNSNTSVKIIKGNERGHFKLDEVSSAATIALIRVASKLDREKVSKYNLTLEAKDKGVPSRSSTAHIVILVEDINDHAPRFKQPSYSAGLSELVPVGSFVAGITAMDNDTGANALVTYSIVSGNKLGLFKINFATGLVTTKVKLDKVQQSSFVLVIKAKDGGASPYSSQVNLSITIWDENDETPTFRKNVYIANITEGEVPGPLSGISTTATDQDRGKNGTVTYQLHPSVEKLYPGIFAVNKNTGTISSLEVLDRESLSKYELILIASDQGEPPLTSSAKVIVNVNDVNDNVPVIYPVNYFAKVFENEASGKSVVSIKATDKDEGMNSQLVYSIDSGSDSEFQIDSQTGLITTTQSLSRTKYTLYVSVADIRGKQATERAVVEIFVISQSSPMPQFNNPAGYAFSVIESQIVRQFVGQVTATFSQQLVYIIASGDSNGNFMIDQNNGRISSAKPLDREVNEIFGLVVVVKASNAFTKIIVSVTVLDINDNAPVFKIPITTIYFDENTPVGKGIFLAKATDADLSENATVTYSFSPETSNYFSIDQNTGLISLAKPLDAVLLQSFQVSVIAKDSGTDSKSSSISLTLIVSDVNDHTPYFNESNYEISVAESMLVNKRFFQITAEDSDEGKNGKISYKIIHGNTDGNFGIFPDGLLYIAKPLDRENKSLYVLQIEASDSGTIPRNGYTNVTIHILDSNDNDPQFSNATFYFNLVENSDAGLSVGRVIADDVDLGKNRELSFSLEGDHRGFEVEPETGVIYSTRKFDREALITEKGTGEITLTVKVTDNGEVEKRSSKATVIISIKDANDMVPVFTEKMYETSISEASDIDNSVLKVSASDSDIGKNSQIRYSIINGNKANMFSIGKDSGLVSLKDDLDREKQDLYQLTIMATDLGSPSLNATTLLRIKVLDSNDNAPVFVSVPRVFNLSENTEPRYLIGTFEATDEDLGNNGILKYSITRGNIDTTFNIESRTGKLYLALPLDYEKLKIYKLDITATDNGQPPFSSSITVNIFVNDENDYAPTFPTGAIVTEIEENIPVGTNVVTVTANDLDSDINGKVQYSIVKQVPAGDLFSINSETGEIKTAGPIDREFSDRFLVTIKATDMAMPNSTRLSSEKVIRIIVSDLNDNAPIFVSQTAASVMVNAQANTIITRINATDPDAGDNAKIEYTITNGNIDVFSLESSTGNLYLRRRLNERVLSYPLTVQAKDKGSQQRSSFHTMTIFARLSEENGPQFTETTYEARIDENQPAGLSVITVSATYSDGSRSDSGIEYYITKVTANNRDMPRLFDIKNPRTGTVTTSQLLDKEAGYSVYNVEVTVVDTAANEPSTRSTIVQVTLIDQNDSPPVFVPEEQTEQISEDKNPGDIVATIAATDPDVEGSLTYSIVSGADGKFSIDPATGQLSILSKLNREEKSTYTITVEANDGVQVSRAKVIIKVTDVNDEKPEFLQPFYYFDIPENTETGVSVGEISAVDKDETSNAQVTYSIQSHWGRQQFSLHPHTGVFTLIDNLDFEQVHQYILTVKATDSGPNPKSSSVTVYMNVIDQNDNSPLFDPSSYSVQVSENATVGTSVMQVTATDVDSAANSDIAYSVIGGDIKGVFAMGPTSGELKVAGTLDRESQRFYHLVVEAVDRTTQPGLRLTSTALISVTVTDVNDNAPEFIIPPTITVKENSIPNTPIYTVTAIDSDQGESGVVEYALLSSAGGLFTIGKVDGQLKITRNVDREEKDKYNITVRATDKGSPTKFTDLLLHVLIGDANDHAPVFHPKTYSKTMFENIPIGSSLMILTATDGDIGINAEIRYVIVSGDETQSFYLDSHSGELSVNSPLDYESKQNYHMSVMAYDLGQPQKSDLATVNIEVKDINDCPPQFLNVPYIVYVQEGITNTPVYVTHVQAYDCDSGYNAKLSYSISEGSGLFSIDSTSGIIKVNQVLDRESVASYEMLVSATDTGSPRLTSSTSVTVMVSDANDHTPTFEHAHYRGIVKENVPAPVHVATVTAVDLDGSENGKIRYSLVANGNSQFQIEPDTGVITTTTSLDREVSSHYNLIAMAKDNAMLPRSSTVEVSVVVEDDNDNSPKFLKNVYQVVIRDPTNGGSFIVGVTALDKDTGVNSQVEYSMTGGSDINNFNLNPNTGIITAAKVLQSADGTFTFTVAAHDKGSSTFPDTTTVQVTFLPSSASQFPTISTANQNLVIPETTSMKTAIATVTATSVRPEAVISYSIAGGNTADTFQINQQGIITLKHSLDYEQITSYNLWVEATDQSSSMKLSDYIGFNIQVTDMNDSPPIFDKLYYNASVNEIDQPPVSVITVTASDADSGESGRITYELVGGNQDNFFAINEVGEIRTQAKLDREKISAYKLVVTATDHGQSPLTATATIDVNVADYNDLAPKFTRHFNALIPENAPIGTAVLKITTTDGDTGPNAVATYRFVDHEDMFAIDHITGWVTLTGVLDRENKKEQYLLKVRAGDGSHLQETSITINVADINDNPPIFLQSSYSFGVAIEQTIGSSVGFVKALDDDRKGVKALHLEKSLNSQVWYRLKHPSSFFSLNAETGEIKLIKELKHIVKDTDLSMDNNYTFSVIASDRGDPILSSEVKVTVKVTPANQHAPVFDLMAYSIPVAENSQLQLSVGQVSASDGDFGENGQIIYSITAGNGTQFFSVDPQTGVLQVKESLIGHRTRWYVLTVKAQDKGTPSQNSTVKVILMIIEANSFSPVFENTVFTATVPENKDVGSNVIRVLASDRDDGLNGQVTYHITGGNEDGKFGINPNDGYIFIHKSLDYEAKKMYHLTITARDKGPVPNEANRMFTITVTDVNDYPPTFKEDFYSAIIMENQPSGTFVYHASAEDKDADLGPVEYYITGKSAGMTMFDIKQGTGIITTKSMLDYEAKSQYTLTVKALNPGTTLSGTTTVEVFVKGVNEYAPQFKKSIYNWDVQESATIGTVVGTVSATDQDKGVDGNVEYYLIEDSNLQGFTINTFTGAVSVVQEIDREATSEIVLKIMAKNMGPIRGQLLDICEVRIRVGDANDPPRFTQSLYEKHILENADVGNSVIQVTANDKDLNNANRQFYYSIESGNVGNAFDIGRNTGVITVAVSLDRETLPVYTMIVAATDSGSPPKTGTTSVKIHLDDINDNGPYFIPEIPVGNLTENQTAKSEVAMNLYDYTFDRDISLDEKQVYYYTLMDHRDKFEVGLTSGLIQAKIRLDREQVAEYFLKLRVADSGSPEMTSTLTAKIRVVDQNDNPSFPRQLSIDVYTYAGELANGAVADVHPKDKDIVGNYQCQLKTAAPFRIVSACNLHANSDVNIDQAYNLDFTGSDGIHDIVSYQAKVAFKRFDQSMIDSSIILKLSDETAANFLNNYQPFIVAVNNAIQGQGTAEIYSMLQTGKDFTLFIAPKESNGKILSRNALVQAIETNKAEIEMQCSCKIEHVNYNPCSTSPCKNAGECSSNIQVINEFRQYDIDPFIFTSASVQQSVKCTCTGDYTGPTCEIPINKCQRNPCKNQGICSINPDSSFTCQCTKEWKGPTCEQDVNECVVSRPCRNGGTCHNKAGSYECECPLSFTGKNCTDKVRPCILKPCKNNGECTDSNGAFQCKCKYGFRGETCEIESKGFTALSYMEFSRPLDQANNFISMEIATRQQNSLLLLYQSQSTYEFLALEIIQGKVRLSYSLGNEKIREKNDIVRITSPVIVTDGQWYNIVATRVNKVGSVKVSHCPEGKSQCDVCQDGDTTCHVSASGGLYQVLDAVDSTLYLGGISGISVLTAHPNQINSHGFIGCMRNVKADGDLFQLTPKQSNGTTDYCPRDSGESTCTSGVCGQDGVCVDKWSSYSCKCPPNKAGPQCNEDISTISFGINAVVQYSVKGSYKRNLLLNSSPVTRKRRATSQGYSFSLLFKTYEKSGLILHAQTGSKYLSVYLTEGKVSCKTDVSTINMDKIVNDGEWYNLTLVHSGGTDMILTIADSSSIGQAPIIPLDLWDTFSLGSSQHNTESTSDMAGFNGCIDEFLVNGEALPMKGYSDKYTIVANDGISGSCDAYLALAGKDGPPTQIVIIVICTLFAVILIGILLAFVIIVYRRRMNEKKKQPPFQNGSMFSKSNGDILSKTKMNNDSGRSHPDSGIAEDENHIINEHIQNELITGGFEEREIRGSLNSNRPDIVASEMLGDRNPEESDDGFDNNGYSDAPEHYDLDNASSIAPSDLLDFTQHYKRYRMGQIASHNNKYKGGHKHIPHRHTPSPSVLASRQSPASVSVQMGRQSPADLLGGRMTPQASQLTVENVNQLNRQTPVNQLSRASPAPNIPLHHDRITSQLGPTSMRSTPLSGISGLYPSNISNSTSYSETSGLPNGHIRGRPNSKLKQPINQVGLRNTPTKGLTIEEVNRLNARHTPPTTTLDVISSSSEEGIKNNINQTDFTHSDLLEPSNSMLPPESSSEEETNDSFTCSEFEDDPKIRNDRIPARNFPRLPRVNEHDDTDTTLNSRGRNIDTDSNRESHTSTFFTASEEDFPRKIAKTKFPNNLISLDSLLNWGTNYGKLVGVFQDISALSQPETPRKAVHEKSSSMSSDRSRPASRASQSASPRPYLPPKPSRVASPGMRVMGGAPSGVPTRHIRPPLPPSPLVPKQPPLLNGHVKQSSIASIASSHDRQSSISSVHSSRSGRPVPNHHHQLSSSSSHLPVPAHSRSSSRSSLSSSRQPMYNPHNPQPPPPPPSIAQALKVVEGKANNIPPTTPAREEYV